VCLAGTAVWADVYPDSSMIVWTDSGTGKLQKIKLASGSTVQDLATGLSSPKGVSFNPALGRVYWTDPDPVYPTIFSCRLDGTDAGGFDAVGPSPRGLATASLPHPTVPGAYVDRWFWTDATEGKLYRHAGTHGGGLEPIGFPPVPIIEAGLVTPAGVALDAAHDGLFITDTGAGKLLWANQDGSGLTALVTGLSAPWGITYIVPEPCSLLMLIIGVFGFRRRV
jgi:DNA-binding beta-propeller fold protein YncE